MKNSTIISTIVCLFFFSQQVIGQISQGTFSLGPSIDYSSSSTEIDGFDVDIKSSDLILSLSAGYYVIDNLEIGLSVGIISSKDEFDDDESTSNGVFFGPHLQYKIQLSNEFYIPVGANIGHNSVSSDDDFNEVTFTGMSYGLWTGIEFISNNKLGAALLVGPQFGSLKDSDSDSEFDLTTFGAQIGISFYF